MSNPNRHPNPNRQPNYRLRQAVVAGAMVTAAVVGANSLTGDKPHPKPKANYVIEDHDDLWTAAQKFKPNGDVRDMVDKLTQKYGTTVYPGETIDNPDVPDKTKQDKQLTTDTTVIGQGEGAQDAARYFLEEHGQNRDEHDIRQLGDEIAAQNGDKPLKAGEMVQNPQELPNDK